MAKSEKRDSGRRIALRAGLRYAVPAALGFRYPHSTAEAQSGSHASTEGRLCRLLKKANRRSLVGLKSSSE